MITNLVFEGGGIKGIAYAGALAVLEDHEILQQIERVAGTSGGAVTACLVSLNYRAADIGKAWSDMKLESKHEPDDLNRQLRYYGLHQGDYFLGWLKKLIADSPLKLAPNATFSDFKKAGARDLHVFASDLYTQTIREFSPQSTPDVTVAEAVRASMSIPIYFNAWRFSNNSPDDHLYIDGGLLRNYPLETFDDGPHINLATLGFRFADLQQQKQVRNFGYGHLMEYINSTFECITLAQRAPEKTMSEQCARRTVIIDDLGLCAADFDVNDETKKRLLESGRSAAEKYLEKITA